MKEALKDTEGEEVVHAKIAAMSDSDRAMAERVHAIVMKAAPGLTPRTWYGMPAYAKDGKVICFFQDAAKFKARYATIGFSDKANLDEGNMWPTAFALTKLTRAEEKRIAELVKQAAS
ncbi:MAG: iron chaperone [Gaiellaceae bacterium]